VNAPKVPCSASKRINIQITRENIMSMNHQLKKLAVATPPSRTLLTHHVAAALFALSAAGMASHAIAQASTPPAAQKVEKIEVTGSNIKRVDAETSAPIIVISADEIKKSGATTVQELLKNLSITSGSSLSDITGGNGFSAGTSSAALRGLGSAATLTLLNGRRISPAAFNDPNVGSTSITNLNSIPAAAIERIEILKDGASAVYGSDAIAGVINIILRKDFTGVVATGSISQNIDNEFNVKQANVIFGFGDLANDRYNVFGSYERFERKAVLISAEDNVDAYLQNTALIQRQTVFSTLSYPGNYYREAVRGSGIFGTFQGVQPNCPPTLLVSGTCRYNQWADLEQTGKSIRDTGYLRGTMDVNANLSLFGDASLSRTTNTFTGAPPSSNPQTATIWRNAAGQPLRFQLILPVGHPDNPYTIPIGLRYRWADLGRVQTLSKTEDIRILAGAKGTARNWDWESGFLYNKSTADVLVGRRFLFPAIQEAINDGSYRFGGVNSQAVIDRISTSTRNKGESTAKLFDLKGATELGSLAGGAIGLALGLELRKDETNITPDQRIVDAQIVGLGASFGTGSRTVKSGYAELVAPVLQSVETTFALRHDRYSDFGNTTNPKVGIKWKPTTDVALRGSYSTGFRAPTLSQISRSAVRSFQTVRDPVRCPVTLADEDCVRTVSAQIVFNPDIKPEKSSSRTLGVIWDATKSLNITLDYFDIRRTDEIDRLSSAFVVLGQFNGDPRFANSVGRDPNPLASLPGIPNSGPIQTVDRQWLNLGGSQVTGLDLDIRYNMNLGEYGKLTNRATGTYNLASKFAREKGDPLVNYVGGYNSVSTGISTPRARGTLSTNWDYRDWNFGLRTNFVGSYNLSNSQLSCVANLGAAVVAAFDKVCTVKRWHTFDANVTYTGVKDLTVTLVVRNIQDKKPPFDYIADFTLGYNSDYHNPLGMYPSLNLSYKFK
jgi:iron complex outermembrane recepter protein